MADEVKAESEVSQQQQQDAGDPGQTIEQQPASNVMEPKGEGTKSTEGPPDQATAELLGQQKPPTDPVTNSVSPTPDSKPQATGSEQQTHISPELLVKHPLQYRWVLWYCKSERGKNWEDCLKEVAVFDTVEDFWALYNHIQLASGLSWQSDYYLFKEGIKPMWEDSHNIAGGRWLVLVDKNRRNELLDHYWLELLMAMIGEQFEQHGEHICGAVVNIRNKGDKVSLWTRDAANGDVCKRIGDIMKNKLGIIESIRYEAHKENSSKQSSMAKPIWQV